MYSCEIILLPPSLSASLALALQMTTMLVPASGPHVQAFGLSKGSAQFCMPVTALLVNIFHTHPHSCVHKLFSFQNCPCQCLRSASLGGCIIVQDIQ